MGEYADEIVDNLIGNGGWSFTWYRDPLIKTCKFCNCRNLRWQNEKGGKWALHHVDGTKHYCKIGKSFI